MEFLTKADLDGSKEQPKQLYSTQWLDVIEVNGCEIDPRNKRWQVYNTASVLGSSTILSIPVQQSVQGMAVRRADFHAHLHCRGDCRPGPR